MQQEPPEQLKNLLVIHFALFAGQLVFALLSLALVSLKVFSPAISQFHGEIVLGAAVVSLAAFVISRILFKKGLKKLHHESGDIHMQLAGLRKLNLKRWVILEIAGTLCILLFLLTQVFDLFILVMGLVLVFYLTRPTAVNVAQDMGVREHDILNL